MIKKIGEKIGGEDLGFASLCIAATSYGLIYNGAFELRPYAFLFCFSALTLYIYICKLQSPQSRKNIILYAISIILLAYTHWFGCLMIAFYFITEVFLWIKKRNSISFIIPYVILGIFFLPWLILMLMNKTSDLTQYWAPVPSLNSLLEVVKFLLSKNSICIKLFYIAIFIICLYAIIKKKDMNKCYKYMCLFICSILWPLVIIYVYSKFLNPNGSLWVERYFFCVLPQMFIITALPISELLHFKLFIDDKERKISINDITINKSIIFIIVISIISIVGLKNYYNVRSSSMNYRQPYRQVSNLIANTPEAYQENTALMTSAGKTYLTYYFEKQGYQLPQNVFVGSNENNIFQVVKNGKRHEVNVKQDELLNYDVLYLFNVHIDFSKNLLNFVSKNYNLVKSDTKLKFYTYEKKDET